MPFAKKSALTDEAYNVLDIIRTAPYETDIAFGVEFPDGTSKQFFPDAQERFLQLDFLEAVLDDSYTNEFIEDKRKKLKEEGYTREILESLYNPEQHEQFIKYLTSVKDLEGLEYTPRDIPVSRQPIPSFFNPRVIDPILRGVMHDLNEDQRAQAAARGADPNVNYLSLVKDSDLKVDDLDAYTDLIRSRQLGSREPNVIEMEDAIHRFDPTAKISPMDFNNPNDGQFIVKSELLTGGKPVPFGNIQPMEDPESLWV